MQEISQLYKIFEILGTPDETSWPGVSKLPDYLPSFPKWRPMDMGSVLKDRLEPDGLDLLRCMLQYPPSERITPGQALKHRYFADLANYAPGTRLPIG